jgi:hypothetical protein
MNSLHLSDAHRQLLQESTIRSDVAEARGYQTISNSQALPPLFTGRQRERHGLLIPIRNVTGAIATYQLRPDNPRHDARGKAIKYETAAAGRSCLDVPEAVRPYLIDTSERLWITEGCRKVDSGLSNGLRAIVGLTGVWNFRGTHQGGGKALLPDWDFIALNGREVVVAFDSDVMRKDTVRAAIDRLSGVIKLKGGIPRYAIMHDLPNGKKQGLDDFFAAGHTINDLNDLIVDELPDTILEWSDPIPLATPYRPPFPTEALPAIVRDFVEAVAEETQTPPDLPAVVALGAISASVGGKYEILVEGTWTEPVHGQMLCVLDSANRKSSVFRTMTAAIRTHERQRASEDRKAVARWQADRRVREAKLKKLELQAAEIDKPGKSTAADLDLQIAALAEELAVELPPRITRIVADDATAEKLAQLLAEQRGSLAVMSAEGGFFANIGGRYSDQPNLDTVLKGHAGDEIRVDRMGREADYIPRPALTICIATQPETVKELGNVRGFIGKGAAARLWPSFPTSTVGVRKLRSEPVPDAVSLGWNAMITCLIEHAAQLETDADGYPLPRQLRLSASARAVLLQFQEWIEPNLRDDSALGAIKAWGGKLAGAAPRIAGFLHLIDHAHSDEPHAIPVSATTMTHAIGIAEYFAAHARLLYDGLGQHDDLDATRAVLEVIQHLGPEMTKREVYQRLRSRHAFAKAAALDAPLRILEEHSIIRVRREQRHGSIRPSEIIELNPLLNTLNSPKREPTESKSAPIAPIASIEQADTAWLCALEQLSPDMRVDVESIVTELREDGPKAMEAWRRDVEGNADLTDDERVAALLALHLAASKVAA